MRHGSAILFPLFPLSTTASSRRSYLDEEMSKVDPKAAEAGLLLLAREIPSHALAAG